MKKQLLIFALLSISMLNSYSQIIFENGYFINNTTEKVECLIKNLDWESNPTEFEYKLSQDADIQKATIKNVSEFGINGGNKYIRAVVKIDKSSDDPNDLSIERNPLFQEEELFLKVLIEGKASLLFYKNGNLKRFFYKKDDSETNQLIHKSYKIKLDIAQNNDFRQQLFNYLKCDALTINDIENTKYNKKDLEGIFQKYNESINSNYIKYESAQKKDLFNLSFRPGLNSSSLKINNPDYMDIDFGNKLSFRFGIETEFVLPFNKNKWSIILEPTYQYFGSEKTKVVNTYTGTTYSSEVNYQSIEMPLGVRHYFFLNDNSKIFANISYVYDFNNKPTIELISHHGNTAMLIDIKTGSNFAFGMGYKYLDRFNFEIRYQAGRDLFRNYAYWYSDYKTLSVIFGYSIF